MKENPFEIELPNNPSAPSAPPISSPEPFVEVATEEDTIANMQMPPSPDVVAEQIERKTRYFGRTLADVAPFDPDESKDPTILFKNNWLARGQAVELVASSGVGKSSMTMQAAFNWAAGREFLASPMKPLRCAVIQAEDSERDVAEQIEGMRWGLTELRGWTEAEFDRVKGEIYCPTCFIGKEGDEFIKMLTDFQGDMKCDMLFINPVQAFFGGDISNQKDVSHWTRGGIDPIIKGAAYGGENACGAFLVMHTTKFTSGDKQGRANVDDYGEYIGAGSHEWVDWTRAKFTFLKKSNSENFFEFKAAKRGTRLGWRDNENILTTKKIFKHSEGHIYWQEVTDEAELAALDAPKGAVGEDEARAIAQKIVDWIRKNRAVTRTELNQHPEIFRGLGLTRAQLRAAKTVILTHLKEYHLTENHDGIGFADGLRTLAKLNDQQRQINESHWAAADAKAQAQAPSPTITDPFV